jgi:N-acetylmuramic acid 6-phosphate (MurNAc-6-P) etherase
MVVTITGVSHEAATTALERCGYDVKQAILVVKLGITPQEAAERLASTRGRLRPVLDGCSKLRGEKYCASSA